MVNYPCWVLLENTCPTRICSTRYLPSACSLQAMPSCLLLPLPSTILLGECILFLFITPHTYLPMVTYSYIILPTQLPIDT